LAPGPETQKESGTPAHKEPPRAFAPPEPARTETEIDRILTARFRPPQGAEDPAMKQGREQGEKEIKKVFDDLRM